MDPLWITYAWKDDEEGDFSYLVQELGEVGIDATYDKVALIPGRRLWEQIAQKVTESPLSGWAYLLTPNSLESEACREELAYALDRALKVKGGDFPLIGLLHGVRIEDTPPALRVRLCVSLANPDWREEVRAGLEGQPPVRPSTPQSRLVWRLHANYGGNPSHTALEVRPRFDTLMYWRILVPTSSAVARSGWGPAGGGAISATKTMSVSGTVELADGTKCSYFGTGDALSASISAYAVFDGQLPEFVCFGQAEEPLGLPTGELEVFRLQPPS